MNDEGGPLNSGIDPVGTIDAGDLDAYEFTICKGENISLTLNELVDNGSFFPWLRLYGPNGVLLRSVFNAATVQISLTATNSGTYIAIISDGNGVLSGTGTYQLSGNGLSDELRLCTPIISGTNVDLSGIGGIPDETFIVFTHTNIITPLSQWTPILTNVFDPFGVFSQTNVSRSAEPERYFRLLQK